MKPAVLPLNCAASAALAAAESRLKGAPRPAGVALSPGGARAAAAAWTLARPWRPGKSGVAGAGERERGLREGGTAPGRGCGRQGRGAGGGERGARGEEAGPRTGAWPRTRFRARRPLRGARPGRAAGAGAAGRG